MNKSNREHGDLTPLGDGAYRDSHGNIHYRKNNNNISVSTSGSSDVHVEINGKRVHVTQRVMNVDGNISIRQEVHNALKSARDDLRKTREELKGIHHDIHESFIVTNNSFHSFSDSNKTKKQKVKKDNWLVQQFKSLITHFTEQMAEKKRVKNEAKEKALAEEYALNAEKERYNKLSIEEKINDKFNYFATKLSALEDIQNEHGLNGGYAISKSILKSLISLKENAIILTTFHNARLSQEAQSLVFQVLPNIIETYHASMNFVNADKMSLTQKLDTGLAQLSDSITQLKNKHISVEQQASTQALDEAFQFAQNRFNDTEDYAQEMIEKAQEASAQKNTKTLKM